MADMTIVYLAQMSLPLLLLWLASIVFFTFLCESWLYKFFGIAISVIVLLTIVNGTYGLGDILITSLIIIAQFMFGFMTSKNND